MISISKLREDSKITVLRLRGELDESGVDYFRRSLLNCLNDQDYNLVLNLSEANLTSYRGIHPLVERASQFRNYGGDIRLVGVNEFTRRLFRMNGILDKFEIYNNEELAIESYKNTLKTKSNN